MNSKIHVLTLFCNQLASQLERVTNLFSVSEIYNRSPMIYIVIKENEF